MAENTYDQKFFSDSRKLSVLIYAFLLDQRYKRRHIEKAKRNIDKAIGCLEKAFKFRYADYITVKVMSPLEEIFASGCRPVQIKNRIAAESHKQQGNYFMGAKMFKLAEADYTKSIHLDSRNAIYYCNRAVCKIGQRYFSDAIKDCDKALELDKNYAQAYCWLGLAHLLMDNPVLAIRYYREALKIDPDNPVCISNMDSIRRKLNHPEFRVYEQLFRFSDSLAPVVAKTGNNQTLLQNRIVGDHTDAKASEEYRSKMKEMYQVGDKLESSVSSIKKY